MANLILPHQHSINAHKESLAMGETPIVDHNGKPISAKDVESELQDINNPKRNFKFLMPVGDGWRYYKVKATQNDKWFVGYVKNRRIPRGAIAITARTAFEMMYGVKLAQGNEAERNWSKISDDKRGYVSVNMSKQPNRQFANMNDPKVAQRVIQSAQIHKP